MKIKIRRDDASAPGVDDWLAMNDWFAELREDAPARSAGDDGGPGPEPGIGPEPGPGPGPEPGPGAGPGRGPRAAVAPPRHRLMASAEAGTRAAAAGPRARTAAARARARTTGRAAIGDQLRIPIAWCELGSCISHYADRAALGEADIRARAIAAGWRVDAFGRLACPGCQQRDAGFRTSRPVALWDRDAAIIRALLMTATLRAEALADDQAGPELPADARGRIPADAWPGRETAPGDPGGTTDPGGTGDPLTIRGLAGQASRPRDGGPQACAPDSRLRHQG